MIHKQHYANNAPYTGCEKTSLLIAKYWQMVDEQCDKEKITLSNNPPRYETILHFCYNRIIRIGLRICISKIEFDYSYSRLLA
jgi:hypothetical protein